MNADDAFGQLMRDNKLAIPVARADAFAPAAAPRRVGGNTAVRVADQDIYDGNTEYMPDAAYPTAGLSGTPTETDLEPVVDTDTDLDDNVHAAVGGGAHIVGRDAEDDFQYDPLARAEPVGPIDDAPLARAKRFRRFAQLPLKGAEDFESDAMELAVSLAALDPEKPSLLLTSSARGEGRTETAMRLALAIARRVGSRVLLADFDLKNPRIASRLGIPLNYFTINDVLRGTCPLVEALVASDEDNLYVLPSRPSDRAGDEIIEPRNTQAVLAEIHRTFEFAVLDCGPVGQSEAQILCRLAGNVAIVGFAGQTTAGRMQEAGKMAEGRGGRVAGMLLAGA